MRAVDTVCNLIEAKIGSNRDEEALQSVQEAILAMLGVDDDDLINEDGFVSAVLTEGQNILAIFSTDQQPVRRDSVGQTFEEATAAGAFDELASTKTEVTDDELAFQQITKRKLRHLKEFFEVNSTHGRDVGLR